ncbi:MAG: helix-turn-helix transcriptional regulator [Acidimicrobiia bacterium]
MAERVASPVFVGRRAELAALEAALASAGRTAAVLVGGEAGAGKSRLVGEFTTAAAASGARVLAGACVALGAESLPYAPFMGVLGQLAAEVGPDGIEALVGPGRVDLARLVPELRRPGDDSRPSGPAERAVLFQVVLRTLDALGAEGPLVVVVEDLHWADASSRDLLAFLLGRVHTGVLLVATYRSDEVHRRHPLRPFLAEAARSERVTRVDLAPLSADEVTRQLEAIAGATLPPAVVEAVVARAEGNPFFAEELLAAGGGDELPPDLAEVLTARLSALPPVAQNLVALAAVAGPRIGHDLLGTAAARAGVEFTSAVREAVSGNVLVADASGSYAFRHALLQEAAYAELLPGERATLHAAYAAALAEHPEWATTSAGAAGELTYHYLAARDPARALETSVAAAAGASETYAFAEAHALYEQALNLWDQVPEASELVGDDRALLLQRAADAAVLAGATARATTLVGGALDELDVGTEPARAALLHERLARLLSERGETEASLAASRLAVSLMPDEPCAERAQVIGGEARALALAGHYEESRARAEAAVEEARRAGARREKGYALNTLGTVLGRLGQPEKAVVLLEEALVIAEAVGSLEDMRRAYNNLVATLDDALGKPGRAAAVGLAGADRLESLNYEMGATYLRSAAAVSLMASGSWAEAERHAAAVLAGLVAAPDVIAAWHARIAAGTAALRRGDFVAAHRHLERAQSLWSESTNPDYRAMVGAALAELALAEGLLDDARAAVDVSLQALAGTEARHSVRLLASLGLRAEADRSRRATRALTEGEARQRAEALIELARATRVRSTADVPTTIQGEALLALCEAEWARVRGEHDGGHWAQIAQAWAASYPYESAYARWREAEALLASGAKEDAVVPLRQAFSEASRLGAGPLLADVEALARRARIRVARTTAEETSESAGGTGLTPREVEVLALLAAGHSNHQIAEALFMSDKTASVHVSRILTKLGVANRGQAAALAHRLGMIEERSAR